MPRPEKIRIVEDMTESFKSAGSIFVTDYAGLKVSDMTELRTRLREAGVRYRIVKNTFLRRAADNAGLSELSVYFKGPTAVALGPADPIDLGHAQFVARGQEIGIVGAEWRGRRDDSNLLDAGGLGRYRGH